jgi:hypothetical protein
MENKTKVMIYWNLHKLCWSVKALTGENRGRVIKHVNTFHLSDVSFRVSEAGRQRVIREKRKNVHAGVVGYLCDPRVIPVEIMTEVTYNPYFAPKFINKSTQEEVSGFAYATSIGKRVFCHGS